MAGKCLTVIKIISQLLYFLVCNVPDMFLYDSPRITMFFQRKKRKSLSDVRSSRGFLRKRSSRNDCSWGCVFIMGFYSCVFQHILIMHVNDSLQPLFVLTHSYSDPKTLLIFHFLYLFFTDRLCSCFLPQKDQQYVLLRSVNFIISRGGDFSCSALLFY